MEIPRYISIRIIFVAVLAVLCLALSYNKIIASFSTKEISKPNVDSLFVLLDTKIDTILFEFTIQENWIKKREVQIPGTNWKRTLREVYLPKDTSQWKTIISPTLVNKSLHELARKYNCEPSATQVLKKQMLFMNMKFEGIIVEQIQLTTTDNLPSLPKSKVSVANKKVVKSK
jgi:hypothetical protein